MRFILLGVLLFAVIATGQDVTTTTLLEGLPEDVPEVPAFKDLDLFAKIAAVFVALNLALAGISEGLKKLGILVPFLSGVTEFLQKVVDFMGMNKKH